MPRRWLVGAHADTNGAARASAKFRRLGSRQLALDYHRSPWPSASRSSSPVAAARRSGRWAPTRCCETSCRRPSTGRGSARARRWPSRRSPVASTRASRSSWTRSRTTPATSTPRGCFGASESSRTTTSIGAPSARSSTRVASRGSAAGRQSTSCSATSSLGTRACAPAWSRSAISPRLADARSCMGPSGWPRASASRWSARATPPTPSSCSTGSWPRRRSHPSLGSNATPAGPTSTAA